MRPTRHALAVAVLAVGLVAGGAACSSTDSSDDSGAVTKLDQVGPDIAKLRAEVEQLREEVRELRQQLAGATTTTAPLR